jgi:hypothetical protein
MYEDSFYDELKDGFSIIIITLCFFSFFED